MARHRCDTHGEACGKGWGRPARLLSFPNGSRPPAAPPRTARARATPPGAAPSDSSARRAGPGRSVRLDMAWEQAKRATNRPAAEGRLPFSRRVAQGWRRCQDNRKSMFAGQERTARTTKCCAALPSRQDAGYRRPTASTAEHATEQSPKSRAEAASRRVRQRGQLSPFQTFPMVDRTGKQCVPVAAGSITLSATSLKLAASWRLSNVFSISRLPDCAQSLNWPCQKVTASSPLKLEQQHWRGGQRSQQHRPLRPPRGASGGQDAPRGLRRPP